MPADREDWKPVGRLGKFEVSSFGRIRVASSGKLKPTPQARSGYLVVNLYAHGISNVRNLHSLVAEAFIGPRPTGQMVVHLDFDPHNNHYQNLAYRPLSQRSAANSAAGAVPGRRLSLLQAQEIFRRAQAGEATVVLAKSFGVSAPLVSDIKYRRKWRLAGGQEDRENA